jgi:hypothetical protein
MTNRPSGPVESAFRTFDIDKFNQQFNKYLEDQRQERVKRESQKIIDLSQVEVKKKLHEMSIGEILLTMKDEIFALLDDLINGKFELDTFLKNNRLFFIGLLILLFVYFYQMVSLVFGYDEKECPEGKKIVISN